MITYQQQQQQYQQQQQQHHQKINVNNLWSVANLVFTKIKWFII